MDKELKKRLDSIDEKLGAILGIMKITGLILTFFTSFFISSEENQFWKPTFEQIILFVDKYDDKGASASYVKENSLEVKAGNPPEFLVKVYIYDHPSSGIVLRSRFSRLDGGAVVMSGDEGIPMLTKDYETPEEAEETLFGLIDLLFEEGFVHFSVQN